MNKEERIKKQTKKFFWEQKIEEITKFLTYSILGVVAISVASFIGRLFDLYLYSVNEDSSLAFENMNLWYEYLVYGIIGMILLFALGLSIYLIYLLVLEIIKGFKKWIDSNWESAEERAREIIK